MTKSTEKRDAPDRPQPLPRCAYPKAEEAARHGLQKLPAVLPLVNYATAQPHRSVRYKTQGTAALEPAQRLQMAQVVGASFAKRDPMARHLHLPELPPEALQEVNHTDAYGTVSFGPWTKENVFYWMIRLLMLTDPTHPLPAIPARQEVMDLSLVILDAEGQIIGGAFNDILHPTLTYPPLRPDAPFIAAVMSFFEPILGLLEKQEVEALTALRTQYPAFRAAQDQGNVGYHDMIARSDALPTEDTFELVAASAERFQRLGYAYMVILGVNQWTGAACEALGGVAVHFAPFRTTRTVSQSTVPLEHSVASPDGFISDKDSGSMFYVIRLR